MQPTIWAKATARQHQVDDWSADQLAEAHQNQELVIGRLLAIARFVWAGRAKVKKPQTAVAATRGRKAVSQLQVLTALNLCKHVLRAAGDSWLCVQCLARSPKRGSALIRWLDTTCDTAGLLRPHHTHRCGVLGQLVWCKRCGAWSTSRYRGLADRCLEEPSTGLQRLALRRISAGKPPPGVDFDSMADAALPPRIFDELEVQAGEHGANSISFVQQGAQPKRRKKNVAPQAPLAEQEEQSLLPWRRSKLLISLSFQRRRPEARTTLCSRSPSRSRTISHFRQPQLSPRHRRAACGPHGRSGRLTSRHC